ncbi:MAG: type III pantothenate kinase [bacterium]|nr:type III pantothenate kinase [bacterium]MDT8394892.1 type III pantothenate kinase [bacterium]
MLLCVDVGNTQTVLGIFRGKEITSRWRIRSDRDRTADEYGHLIRDLLRGDDIDEADLTGMSVSSVVPPARQALMEMAKTTFGIEPLMVGPGIKTGMPILYDNPREVGADRIANAVAAYERFGRDLIVIDFGTAITFDVITAAGQYQGGVIFPGVQISLDALFLKAARLPRVELEKPARVVGRDTTSSIQSGIVNGYAGLVDSLVGRIAAECGTKPLVVATGGLSGIIASETTTITEILPDLTLEGLKILWERNR